MSPSALCSATKPSTATAQGGAGRSWRRRGDPTQANRKAVISFDRDMYRWRYVIENTFAKLKEFRAVAIRYDKTDNSYAATIHLAAAIIACR
jgi:transposase